MMSYYVQICDDASALAFAITLYDPARSFACDPGVQDFMHTSTFDFKVWV